MSQIFAIQAVFDEQAARPCLLGTDGTVLTYAGAQARAVAAATRFAAEGVEPGDVVAVLAENSVELAIDLLGLWTAGAIAAPINKDLGPQQIAGILSNAGPKLILAAPAVIAASSGLADLMPERMRPVGAAAPTEPAGAARIFERLIPHDPFMIIYTAGSTGEPKGVQLTPEALFGNERLFCEAMGVNHRNRFYNILPMSYLGGLHNLLLLPLSVGASVVIDAPLGPSNLFYFWRRVRDLEIDTLWFTGAMLSMLLQIPPRGDESWIGRQVRLGLVGMAPLDRETRGRFEAQFGFPLRQNYALSETLFLTSQRPGAAAEPVGCGRTLPGIDIELRRADGTPAGSGEDGELFIRSPYMMAGYRNAAPADTAALSDGVFRSGDIGRFDQTGELLITGRMKDLIIRGGLNIAPSVVEGILLACPGVVEAAVVGVADPIYGEEVAAVVVGEGPRLETRVMEFAEQRLPHFQRPKTVAVWDALPRNSAHKIDKPAIRKRLAAERPDAP